MQYLATPKNSTALISMLRIVHYRPVSVARGGFSKRCHLMPFLSTCYQSTVFRFQPRDGKRFERCSHRKARKKACASAIWYNERCKFNPKSSCLFLSGLSIEENIKKRPTNGRQKKEPAYVSGHVSTCSVASNKASCTHRLSTDLYNALKSGRWNRSEAPDLKINRIKSDLQLKRNRHGNCCKHKAALNTWQTK